jgi:hypothetical protein
MSECRRAGKWIRGCRFEARYDEGAPVGKYTGQYFISDAPDIIRALRPITYVHDVCTRCGKTIDRPHHHKGT